MDSLLVELAQKITGKTTRFERCTWYQSELEITIPITDPQGLLHEICHWIVATEAERTWPNLFLDWDEYHVQLEDAGRSIPKQDHVILEARSHDEHVNIRERQACYIEKLLCATHFFPAENDSCGKTGKVSETEREHADTRLANIPNTLVNELIQCIKQSRYSLRRIT
jgi:hypothetical protein